jgi:hypothetical protein
LASAPWTAAPDPREPQALRCQQPDDRDERLLVAQHERGELEATPEPVPAGRTPFGLHRDAHVLQAGDVSPHRPRAHLEPAGDLLGVELAVHLEQLDEREQTAKRKVHLREYIGRILSLLPCTI